MANEGEFRCSVCGEVHALSMKYSVAVPQAAMDLPTEQLDERLVISADQCVIDGKDFYLRGRILIPVIRPDEPGANEPGRDEPFVWGVWAEVGPKDFLRTNEQWTLQGREAEPAFPGWLNTKLTLFGDTINLEVRVQTQAVGRRPQFTVVDGLHPLALDQRNGITLQRVRGIAQEIFHLAEATV